MKLSKYIEELQEILNECGDLNCVYSADEEGNYFQFLHISPSVQYAHITDNCVELVSADDIDEYFDLLKVCLVN